MKRLTHARVPGLATALLLAVVAALLPGPTTARAGAVAGTIAGQSPVAGTPDVLDGRVTSVVRVGDRMVLGGTFTRVREAGGQELARRGVLAFDPATGLVDRAFDPRPDGAVNVVQPGLGGGSVLVGGSFSTIAGARRDGLAEVRLADGALTGFDPGRVNGEVNDLRLVGTRLWVAGRFSRISGHAQPVLATLQARTGRFDPYMGLTVGGVHRAGRTSVAKIDVSLQQDRLVVIGNFRRIGGKVRDQLGVLSLAGTRAAVAPYRTRFFEASCARAIYSYVRDVDIAPGGRWFVVATTGAYHGAASPCDTTSRFELRVRGSDVRPSWVDSTGGDTTHAVEATEDVVYTGGHARWQNNPLARNRAGAGAVRRTGIAALDAANGLPYTWNPTRRRGVGVFDFLLDQSGLWVASDTDVIAGEVRGRIALLPHGPALPAVEAPASLERLFLGGPTGQLRDPDVLHRINGGGPPVRVARGRPWSTDTAASPDPHRGSRQRPETRPRVRGVRGAPAGTPRRIFSTALRSPQARGGQSWTLPVPEGTRVQVRLYFAPPCACRRADRPVLRVRLDGTTVLPRLHVRRAGRGDVGFVRTFATTSDGRLDVQLKALRGRALLSGLEVVRTDGPAPFASRVLSRAAAGSGFGPAEETPDGGLPWSRVTGAFMLDGQLYLGTADGRFTRRTFDGSAYGAAVRVDASDALVPLASWRRDLARMRGLFYDEGRLYYTLAGSSTLYYRYFTAESDVVGTRRLVAATSPRGLRLDRTRGMALAGPYLYAAMVDGELRRVRWQRAAEHGAPDGRGQVVSGPERDQRWWTARTLFALDRD